MPILGVIASGISGNLYSASFDSIATITVASGTQSSIEFTSIPATYTHLQIRALIRSDNGLNSHKIQLNNDTGANYTYFQLYADGSTVTGSPQGSANNGLAGYNYSSNTATAGATVIDILDYRNTNKNTIVRSLDGSQVNGAGLILYRSALWSNTAAVTNIKFTPVTGNYAQYTQFALYGIKVA